MKKTQEKINLKSFETSINTGFIAFQGGGGAEANTSNIREKLPVNYGAKIVIIYSNTTRKKTKYLINHQREIDRQIYYQQYFI